MMKIGQVIILVALVQVAHPRATIQKNDISDKNDTKIVLKKHNNFLSWMDFFTGQTEKEEDQEKLENERDGQMLMNISKLDQQSKKDQEPIATEQELAQDDPQPEQDQETVQDDTQPK